MRCGLLISALCVAAGMAAGGDDGDVDRVSVFGTEFALIGDAGNRDTDSTEVPMYPEERVGGVGYEYAMATTEVTVGQYFEFVEAYYPFYIKAGGNSVAFVDFTGTAIHAAFGEVAIRAGHSPDEPTNMGWEYAARYCNWLHNGKVVEEWAFETGVYDTSTFVQSDDGTWLTQAARSPGARVFMPTWDEWIKAGYWDPDKNNGQGGYWLYPTGSDTEPRPGLPEEGGERNAGDTDTGLFPLAVGSYPNMTSPWGMYDMSGGQSEYTETPVRPERLYRRILGGTRYSYDNYGDYDSRDILAYGNSITTFNSQDGLRLGLHGGGHPADLNDDGEVNYFDIARFIRWFIDGDERADFRLDGVFDLDDVQVFLGWFSL